MASKKNCLILVCVSALLLAATGCGSSSSSNPTSPPVDTQPPTPPNGLSIDYAPRDQVLTITWDANVTDPDLAGYLIDRGIGNGEPVALVSVPQSATYFVDEDFQGLGRLLTYYVYAVDTSGNASAAATISLTLDDEVEHQENPHRES